MENASEAATEKGEATPALARPFPFVGMGASAGGVQALTEFFRVLPDDVEAAFVVIVHLDPTRQSELSQILADRTKMPVIQVEDRVPLEPRHVYVIPPDRKLVIDDRHVATGKFDEPRWHRAPIDLFFRSLAAQHGEDFAIVLSGAGSDGAVGVKAIKESGGIILVQDPQEAEYSSMPQSAIATGLADFILPVCEIAARLPELVRNRAYGLVEPLRMEDEEALRRILSHLRARTGHDFSKYKRSTVHRRIARRMQVRLAGSLAGYLTVLRDNVEEAQALFADLLISVTTFFRDPASFQKLADLVIARLFDEKDAESTIRVWVPGCATGEEAYSLGVLLLEEASRHDICPKIQLFASDLDGAALATAREGRYPLAIEADLSEERLRRFFTREAEHYVVKRELRDVVLFATHSLLKDPPFSRLDLVSCRNLLIYLDRELQEQACVTLHYGLRQGGYLFLGSSESADNPPGLFRSIDRAARIYQSVQAKAESISVVQRFAAAPRRSEPQAAPPPTPLKAHSAAAAHHEALERRAPPSVVVDEAYRVIHLSETAGRYLEPSSGPLPTDLTELARPELRFDLRAALHRAFSRSESTLSAAIPVRLDGTRHRVYLQVSPLGEDAPARRSALVMFIEGEAIDESSKPRSEESGAANIRIQQLQQELQLSESQLKTSRQEYEAANEELRAANEELQSINEEYRSTAEELETSKEELQSVNEELQTVNNDLKNKLDVVSRAHADIQNLVAATDVGILFLDPQLRIKRFTPPIANLFHIAPGDEGRPIADFTHNLSYERLIQDAQGVLDNLAPIEFEVGSTAGRWYLMRLRPYCTVENKIDGVVVTFVDITERRRAEAEVRDSEARLKAVVDGAIEAIVTIDERGIILTINKATTTIFGYQAHELPGQDVRVLMPEPLRSRQRNFIQNYLRTGDAKTGMGSEVEAQRKDGSLFPAELIVSEIRHGSERLFIGFLRDLSEKREFQMRLEALQGDRMNSMGEFAASLAHEINQPLAATATYLNAARRLLQLPAEQRPASIEQSLESAAGQVMHAGHILSHLQRFIARGEPDKTLQNLHDLIRDALALTAAGAKQANIQVVLQLNAEKDHILADKIQIEQVLVNLIRNAKQAMSNSEKRCLTISTSVDQDMIRTDVLDTGQGLSEQAKSDLFKPTSSTKADSLGVGLWIAHSIIEMHYGTIWAESNPGGGARFSFTLPLANASNDE
jgi:two-component system CheB/CheR fusion protein